MKIEQFEASEEQKQECMSALLRVVADLCLRFSEQTVAGMIQRLDFAVSMSLVRQVDQSFKFNCAFRAAIEAAVAGVNIRDAMQRHEQAHAEEDAKRAQALKLAEATEALRDLDPDKVTKN